MTALWIRRLRERRRAQVDKDEWEIWYYNRVNQFSNRLISSFKDDEPTINDLVKNKEENSV